MSIYKQGQDAAQFQAVAEKVAMAINIKGAIGGQRFCDAVIAAFVTTPYKDRKDPEVFRAKLDLSDRLEASLNRAEVDHMLEADPVTREWAAARYERKLSEYEGKLRMLGRMGKEKSADSAADSEGAEQ